MLKAVVADIRKIELPFRGIQAMQDDARQEGVSFIDRLVDEWASGANRFDGPGEVLCGVVADGLLVGVGGLNRDPFVTHPEIGRIRRVYVRPGWRHQGLATALVRALIDRARGAFRAVRLRAETPYAAGLYESLGFLRLDDPEATHVLPLTSELR